MTPLPYRARSFDTLVRVMVDAASTRFVGGPSRRLLLPMAGLETTDRSDLSVALIRAWAVVGDVLSFYQERIAAEGYLATARERRSLVELLRSVGYELRPPVAAQTHLALTVRAAPDQPDDLVLPAGIVAETLSLSGAPPVSFETIAAVAARQDWNEMRPVLRTRRVTQALAPGATSVRLAGTSTGLRPGSGLFVVSKAGDTADTATFLTAEQVTVDRRRGETLVRWKTPLPPDDAQPVRRHLLAAAAPTPLLGHRRMPWTRLPEAVRRTFGTPAGGVYRSDGATPAGWIPAADGLPPGIVARLAAAPDGSVYAATVRGVYRRAPEGGAWASTGEVMAQRGIEALHVTPSGQVFGANSRGQVFRSADGGATWDRLGTPVLQCPRRLFEGARTQPLPNATLRGLTVVEGTGSQPQTVLAGGDVGVLRLAGAGGPWIGANRGLPGVSAATGLADTVVRDLAVVGRTGPILLATDRGLFAAAGLDGAWRAGRITTREARHGEGWLRRLARRVGRAWRSFWTWIAARTRWLWAPVLRLLRRLLSKRSTNSGTRGPEWTAARGGRALPPRPRPDHRPARPRRHRNGHPRHRRHWRQLVSQLEGSGRVPRAAPRRHRPRRHRRSGLCGDRPGRLRLRRRWRDLDGGRRRRAVALHGRPYLRPRLGPILRGARRDL